MLWNGIYLTELTVLLCGIACFTFHDQNFNQLHDAEIFNELLNVSVYFKWIKQINGYSSNDTVTPTNVIQSNTTTTGNISYVAETKKLCLNWSMSMLTIQLSTLFYKALSKECNRTLQCPHVPMIFYVDQPGGDYHCVKITLKNHLINKSKTNNEAELTLLECKSSQSIFVNYDVCYRFYYPSKEFKAANIARNIEANNEYNDDPAARIAENKNFMDKLPKFQYLIVNRNLTKDSKLYYHSNRTFRRILEDNIITLVTILVIIIILALALLVCC